MEDTVRLKFTLAYQGTDFAGWQIQPEGFGRSVQACLEDALSRLSGRFVRAHGASRTDSGVHALCQVAHADVPAARLHLPWLRAVNALLPRDVAVTSVETVDRSFHARYAATSKTYTYTLWHQSNFVLPQRRPFVWDTGPLDLAAMELAARELTGEHDFSAFQNAGTPVKKTVRTVDAIVLRPGQPPHESVWAVTGEGFLKQMVRNIMGCLVEVGRGKANAETVRSLLATKDRSLAPATAPARGLCLELMEFGQRERRPGQTDPGRDHPDRPSGEEVLGGAGGFGPR
ncbi:tRNA pseudouridine(38-40) synthase TruA [Fundidesulfovibrio terrae]|uniref:tRNA pseudouridine(38-40) synthase TruA n=1 Tax=Fundidesulfovibrio terrae TaxID=2922866 RepID=UPI001FAFD1BF|nr:tRNA pseudouridine(38-40) synthase TruA [Fundidesulfovibrio terrae]